MASTVLDPTAVLVAAVLDGLAVTPTVKGYAVDPGMTGLDSLPCGVVGPPTIERRVVDEGDSQIGSRDWNLTFPVTLFFDLADTATAQAQATQTVEAFITAVDTATLSVSDASIEDAVVAVATPVEILNDARPMLAYECSLAVLKFTT